MNVRDYMCSRAALELSDGAVVNLGFGIPTGVANFIPEGVNVILQSENGCLMMGPTPKKGKQSTNNANAAGFPITLLPGASVFDAVISFGIIRGGHVDATILGALEVDQEGSIANWGMELAPERYSPGPGGAMDLVASAKKVVAVLQHTDKKGNSKIRKKCSLNLTGKGCVDVVITDKAVFTVTDGAMTVTEIAPGLSVEDLRAMTEAEFTVSPDLCEYRQVAR